MKKVYTSCRKEIICGICLSCGDHSFSSGFSTYMVAFSLFVARQQLMPPSFVAMMLDEEDSTSLWKLGARVPTTDNSRLLWVCLLSVVFGCSAPNALSDPFSYFLAPIDQLGEENSRMKHEWLADQTKLVSSAMETEQLAEKVG